jgi:hypothetical protein
MKGICQGASIEQIGTWDIRFWDSKSSWVIACCIGEP